jgi:hypothetical protein
MHGTDSTLLIKMIYIDADDLYSVKSKFVSVKHNAPKYHSLSG